jgi:hypothetical protein
MKLTKLLFLSILLSSQIVFAYKHGQVDQNDCVRQCQFESFLNPNESALAIYLDGLPSSTQLNPESNMYKDSTGAIMGLAFFMQNAEGKSAEEVYKMLAPKNSTPSKQEIHAFKLAFDNFRALEKQVGAYLKSGKPANNKKELCGLRKGFDAACSLYKQITELKANTNP